MSGEPPVWHLWFPEWKRSPGGIQRYSDYFARAIAALKPRPTVRIFVKNDYAAQGPAIHTTGQWPGPIRTIVFCFKVFWWTWRQRPALVISTHAHFSPLGKILRRLFGMPYWIVVHGVESWQRLPARAAAGLRDADRVLCVSRHTRDQVIALHGVDAARCRLLPNTFDAARFAPHAVSGALRAHLGLHGDSRVILTVARLAGTERFKGYDRVLNVMPRVLQAVPEARYILVGNGDDMPRIKGEISRLGLEGKVVLAGFVPDEELPEYYNLCDVFAMPSRKEGFGIVFLEALACGKPVIAGNADGSVEPLADGELGILIDPDDEEALTRELIDVLLRRHAHPAIFQPEKLRDAARERFGFEAFVARLAEIAGEPRDAA